MTIPSEWVAYYRDDDGELLGYLDPSGGATRARTVFGYPVGGVGADAERVLDSVGLSYLADRWLLRIPDRDEPVIVQIVEATPERLTVQSVDYGFEADYGTRFTLTVPVDEFELRPERPLSL